MPLGIPHSAFLSWDPLDQDKALAFMRDERERCKGCGTAPREWDPKQGGDRFAYVAEPRYCAGCDGIEQEKDNVPEQAKGVYIRLVPKELASDPEG